MKRMIVSLVLISMSGFGFAGDWIWENPLPQGNDLNSVWAVSASDRFAVGDVGTILHFDGSTWTEMESRGPST